MIAKPTALERWMAVGAIGIAVAATIAHAIVAFDGGYLNYVSGIWLAHARDLQQGVFYRDLIGDLGYGGTRYFPLHFIVIAAFMRAGVTALTAGWLASAVAAILLAAGMFRAVRSLGGGRLTASLFAADALSPYFVQQTLFELRADVLAAALNVWGLAFLLPAWSRNPAHRASPTLSALFFTLALATKVTSLAIPGAAVLAAFAAGHRVVAFSVAWRLICGALLLITVVHWSSDGRAVEAWRACLFAGSGAGDTLKGIFGGGFLLLTRYSRLLTALLIIASASLAAAWFQRNGEDPDTEPRALWFPSGLFLGASLSTAAALSSPGTVPSNQMVEWIAVVLVVLAFLVCTRPRLSRTLSLVVCVVVVWTSGQDVARTRALLADDGDRNGAAARQLIADVTAAQGPVLSESPIWPVLASKEVYLLDPFALKVVMGSRKDIEQDVAARIARREFPMILLQLDPTTPAGRGYYEHVNFGWPTVARIIEHYRLESHPLEDVFVYVPRR